MLDGMGLLKRLAALWAVIVGEYLATAAVLAALLYFQAATQPRCKGPCASIGLFLFAFALLVLLAVGLPVALVIATVREYLRRRRSPAKRRTARRPYLRAATIAGAWGLVVAVPMTCLLAEPLIHLLTHYK